MATKISKTLARQQEKISEGNFYEAHQQLRVIASRYIKSSDSQSAASILANGSILLLKAHQGGSGGDLAMMLLKEVYTKNSLPCNAENETRLIEILQAFPRGEPTRGRFVKEAVAWSAKAGKLERGDPDLHDAAGKILAEEGEAYEAERHLVLGTAASVPILAQLHYTWYAADSPHLAATYASRSVFPFLTLGNLSSATAAFQQFTSHLTSANPQLFTQSIESSRSDLRIFPSLPLLNFLSALLLACQRGEASLFKTLTKHYAAHLKDMQALWEDSLANIGEIWFGIKIPKGGNPLMDMMGSMLAGGGGGGGLGGLQGLQGLLGGGGGFPRAPAVKPKAAEPEIMDLD